MHGRFQRALGIVFLLAAAFSSQRAEAGGSGLNTIVVINQTSANSRELANYFCERRQVPPDNVLRISWAGGNISWNSAEFQSVLLNPLLAMLAARGLSNQVDYVVLSMDIPFQVINGPAVNSTTSALYYGLQTLEKLNSYSGSETIFRDARPATLSGFAFLTSMITGDSLAGAKQLVDHGVFADGTFPTNRVVLARSSDSQRNLRYSAFDRAIFDTRLRGNCTVVRTNSDAPTAQTNILGYQTGLANFSISPGTFVPGAIADSFTSFGGIIFGPNGQTSLMAFINAGAAGSYGTVTEPYIDPKKFPEPHVYFYQARGFTLAECYYQSLDNPFEGLIVAEPLAAPFARPGSGQWPGISSNALLSGTAVLPLRFDAADPDRPLQQVDLFVDGKYFRTLTNLPPCPGNQLNLTLQNYTLEYVVPANATIASVASDLTALVNLPVNTNQTGVVAAAYGDRIELSVVATNRPPPPTHFKVSNTGGSAMLPTPPIVAAALGSAPSLTTFLLASRETFLPSPIAPMKLCIINGTVQPGSWMQLVVTRVGGAQVTLSATNQTAGATMSDLAGKLVAAVNAAPALQDLDGVLADGLTFIWMNSASFELRARNAGLRGAGIKLTFTGSPGFTFDPAATTALTGNLADVRSRNHVYVVAGATNLAFSFPLDTTQLTDGFHELTAVAYEGSHVRTQTRASLFVRVQNSALSAVLNPLDLPGTAPAQGTYHLQVAASTNNVALITLFSTGGSLGAFTSQASPTFTVDASTLGAGLHPFHAVVETTSGLRYRTSTYWVRFTP